MALDKYLARYAEGVATGWQSFPKSYQHNLVIPAYKEPISCINGLSKAFATTANALLIIVANRPDNSQQSDDNTLLVKDLENTGELHWQHPSCPHIRLYRLNNIDTLLVDHCLHGPPLAAKQGVGLARKIGMDISCYLFNAKKLLTTFVFTSDADAVLPADYFQATRSLNPKSDAAAILPYQHRATVDTSTAIGLYELQLRYYECALRWADSIYAMQTLGSTLCINLSFYAKVRGFPKRSAGEDFYLLNKLLKTGAIVQLNKPVLELAARHSDRAPFGTGAALRNIADKPDALSFYHPQVFLQLKKLLQAFNDIAYQRIDEMPPGLLLGFAGVDAALEHAKRQSNNPVQCLKQINDWFDAFKTLKYIHHLREHHWPSISAEQLSRARQHAAYQAFIPTVVVDEYLLTKHIAPS